MRLIQEFVSQKEGLYNSLCNETYEIATLNAVQILGVEEDYKKSGRRDRRLDEARKLLP